MTPMIVGVVAVVNVEVVEVIVVSPFHPIPRARNRCWFYKGLLWSQAQDLGIFWHPCRILFCFVL